MADFSTYSVEDLQKAVADKREALRVFRHASAGSHTRNVREGRTLRREVAQLLTELKKRMIDSAEKIA
jgi:ribosomal protein L29